MKIIKRKLRSARRPIEGKKQREVIATQIVEGSLNISNKEVLMSEMLEVCKGNLAKIADCFTVGFNKFAYSNAMEVAKLEERAQLIQEKLSKY